MRLFVESSSLRYQISLRLLLSAFNGILLVGLMAVFLASRPSAEDAARSAMVFSALQDFSRDHLRLVQEGVLWDMEEDLADLERELAGMDPIPTQALEVVAAYRMVLEDEPDLRSQIQSTHQLYPLVLEEVRLALIDQEEPFFERHNDWALAILLWTTIIAILMVFESLRLQHFFSSPVSRLVRAALDVAEGRLDQPIQVSSKALEITQLAQALETMRIALVTLIGRLDMQNAEMSTMLAALDDGVILVDADGRILELNPRASALLADMNGRSPLALEGALLEPLLPRPAAPVPEGAPSFVHAFETPAGRKHVQVGTARLGSPETSGRRAQVVVLQDITRTVEIEEMKRSFLSMVTHELKTPLTVIDGYVRLLLMGKGGPLSDRQKDLLQRTRDQSTVLGGMVQDLLDTTRLESGRLTLDIGRIDAAGAMAEVVEAFASEATTAGLILEALPTPPLPLMADSHRLGQILSNLVRNAIKFTPSGGRVSLRAEGGQGVVRILVTDTGRGIPREALAFVFDKFYQVEQGDTRKAGGAGLGLYICQQLAQAMGGRVEVTSEPGMGTCFIVILPSAP